MIKKYFLTLASKFFSRFRFRWDYIRTWPKSPEKGEGISEKDCLQKQELWSRYFVKDDVVIPLLTLYIKWI
jgi:hypothetical protein